MEIVDPNEMKTGIVDPNEMGPQPTAPEPETSLRAAPPESESILHKTWDKAMDFFGPSKDKEIARASNALVYSEMFNIKPSFAYKYHDQISQQVQDKLASEKVFVERKGYGEAFKSGLQSSIIGMMSRQKTVEPFESVDQIERWINGFTSMGADMPFFLAGYAMAGETPVTGIAGAFGFTEGIRRMLTDRYNKGKVKNFSELMTRTKDAALSTIKGEVVGAATGAAGEIPFGITALNQLATMTTVGKLVEGQVPTARDFVDNAGVLAAMNLGLKGAEASKGALQEVYAKTGRHPAEVVDTLKRAAPLTGEEQEQAPGLRPALKVGDRIVTGEEGETHPDIEKKLGIPIQDIKTAKPPSPLESYKSDFLADIRKGGGIDPDLSEGETERFTRKEQGTTGIVAAKGKGLSPDEWIKKKIESGKLPEGSTVRDFFDKVREEFGREEKVTAEAQRKAYEDHIGRTYGEDWKERPEELRGDEKAAQAASREEVIGEAGRASGATPEEVKLLGDWFDEEARREKSVLEFAAPFEELGPEERKIYLEQDVGKGDAGYAEKTITRKGAENTQLIYRDVDGNPIAAVELNPNNEMVYAVMDKERGAFLQGKAGKAIVPQLRARGVTAPADWGAVSEAGRKAMARYLGEEKSSAPKEVPSERGFTDPEGKFLTREQAAKWVQENEPEVHDNWKSIAGEDAEFHSEDYNEARERFASGNLLSKMMADETGEINLDPAIRLARKGLEKIREGNKSSKYGQALRTFFTGSRDSRIAETNQLRDELKSLIPDYRDQEALSLLRDFKNKRDELIAKREKYEAGDKSDLKKIIPIIDRALNPSAELLEADRRMTDYFSARLAEGKRLGFLDSSLSVDEYITHLLEPEEITAGKKGVAQGKIGRRFQFAKERYYPTVLDALEKEGVKVKTFNALDAMTIYGDKHAIAAATRLLIDELKTTNIGKFGFRDADNIPSDWVELSPGRELFRNRIAVLDKETGEPRTITQNLYVPEVIRKALAPIIDPATISNVPGFRTGRIYQAYIKSVELGLSVFHMKALNITALNNEKLASVIKSYRADLDSAKFKAEEVEWIKDGLTTSILGRTVEAYRAMQPSTFPTRLDIIRNIPGIKQLDHFAEGLTHETFDVMQRKFKVVDASLKDAAWIADHPEATLEEHTSARRSIAKEVNAAYGGLQWENLGVNKNTLEITKALLLAPDWTFSNVLNLKYGLTEGGPAGAASRKFFIKSAIVGIGLSEAMSILVSGQGSKHITEIYLGKDKDGKEVYVNMFFAGAPKDFVTFLTNVQNYGAVLGIAHSIAQKMGPLARTGMDILTNQNWMGQPIVRKQEPFLTKTGKGAAFVASQLAPIPFSISNIAAMLMNDKIDYGMKDYILQLGGSPPRHEAPAGQKTKRKKYREF